MSEAKTSGNKPKKMVSRKVVFALGLICIVLIAFIAYFTVTGISAQNNYTNLQNQNRQLQTWLADNETLLNQTQADNANLAKQIAEQNNTISQLESNITNLQNQIVIANATIATLEASLISTVKIASVTKEESWESTLHTFSFTIQVTNNGTDTVNGITVEIRLYHDWMTVIYGMNGTEPLTKYTNEIQDYILWGNILHFGPVPAGENETQDTHIGIGDFTESGGPVPVNYAVATLTVANITIDEQTLQFNNQTQQTWVFP